MKLQATNNSQPTFGMAIRTPATKAGKKLFAEYININRPFVERGLNRLAYKQRKNPFDIVFRDQGKFIDVQRGNLILESFEIQNVKKKTQEKTFGQLLKQTFKGLYYAAFKPEVYLPKELKMAAKYADEQYKILLNQIKEEKTCEKIEKILNKHLK